MVGNGSYRELGEVLISDPTLRSDLSPCSCRQSLDRSGRCVAEGLDFGVANRRW